MVVAWTMVVVVEVIESNKILDIFEVITNRILWYGMKGIKRNQGWLQGFAINWDREGHFKDWGGTGQVKYQKLNLQHVS